MARHLDRSADAIIADVHNLELARPRRELAQLPLWQIHPVSPHLDNSASHAFTVCAYSIFDKSGRHLLDGIRWYLRLREPATLACARNVQDRVIIKHRSPTLAVTLRSAMIRDLAVFWLFSVIAVLRMRCTKKMPRRVRPGLSLLRTVIFPHSRARAGHAK